MAANLCTDTTFSHSVGNLLPSYYPHTQAHLLSPHKPGYEGSNLPTRSTYCLASSPGHSQILSCSRGEKSGDKIWEWPGDEATYCLLAGLQLRVRVLPLKICLIAEIRPQFPLDINVCILCEEGGRWGFPNNPGFLPVLRANPLP